jgi:FkbM family methyltransferase
MDKSMKRLLQRLEADPNVLLDPDVETATPIIGDIELDLSIAYDQHPAYQIRPAEGGVTALAPALGKVLRRYYKTPESTPIRDGALAFRADPKLKSRLAALAEPLVQQIRRQRAERSPERRGHIASSAKLAEIGAPDEAYFLLMDIAERSGMLQQMRDSLGGPVRLREAVILLKDASDRNLYNVFDGAAPDPKTLYMHIDTGVGVLKAGLYLSEVGPANGPFSYVIDSHKRRASVFDRALRRASDIAGLDSPRPGARAMFMGLPPHLRRKANFGNDVTDGTALSDLLLTNERRFTSDMGDLILFDNDGFHRGGIVDEGERIAVFVIFERGEPPKRPSKAERLYARQTKVHLFEQLKRAGFVPGAVFDVGFAYGTEELDNAFSCPYILVDPVEESVPFMEAFVRRKPGSSWHLAAASSEPGTIDIAATPLISNSTIHVKGLPKRTVPKVRLDDLPRPPGPYLIKIDVEGHELEVLRGATAVLTDTEVVVVEVNFWSEDRPHGRASVVDVINLMDRSGFVIFDFVDANYRGTDAALVQADLVFVKKTSAIRAVRDIRTPEQREANKLRKQARLERAKAALIKPAGK